MKRWLQRYFESIRTSSGDLSLYWFVHLLFILLAVVSAKIRAVNFAYEKMEIGPFLLTLLHVLPYDLLFVSVLAIFILLTRRIPSPPQFLRWVLFSLAPITALLCAFLAHFNFGYYSQMGEPLSAGLLALAPHMAIYLLPSVKIEGVIALIGILFVSVVLLAITPLFIKSLYPNFVRDNRWTYRPLIYTGIVVIPGMLLLTRPALGIREVTLREMTIPTMFISADADYDPYTLDEKSRAELIQLCGPVDNTGKDGFADLPRRPYNVVIWVMESTGFRYLKSMHPLGWANTPHLDRILKTGSVRFDAFYSECPLSVQSGWAMLTGAEPVPFPARFVTDPGLPPHEPQITTVLKEHKYNTAVIVGGPSSIWGLDKIAHAGTLDRYEDLISLQEAGFEARGWGIEGKAINQTFLKFIDSKPGERFFGLLWQVESHDPYRYLGMPESEGQMRYFDRYPRSIEHVDRLFGDFYNELGKRNLLNDTIIVIVGDHGEGMGRGSRPFDVSHSHHVYEDGIHVPLFILHPALKEAKPHVHALCSHKDIPPTILDLCGFPTNPAQPGVSLAAPIPPRPLFARTQRIWPMSVRAGNYKLILGSPQAVPELFDVIKDPLEQISLTVKNKSISELLSAAIRERGAKMPKPRPAPAQ